MVGYLFLILTVLSFGLLGILHKIADFKQCRPSAINAHLFISGWCLMSCYVLLLKSSFGLPAPAAMVAIGCGISASLAILTFQIGVRFGKIATSWLIINLSTAVPTVLSVVIYGEQVGFRRGLALGAITVSLFCLWKDKRIELVLHDAPSANCETKG